MLLAFCVTVGVSVVVAFAAWIAVSLFNGDIARLGHHELSQRMTARAAMADFDAEWLLHDQEGRAPTDP